MKVVQANLAAVHAGETPHGRQSSLAACMPRRWLSRRRQIRRNPHRPKRRHRGLSKPARRQSRKSRSQFGSQGPHHRHCWRMPPKARRQTSRICKARRACPRLQRSPTRISINRKVGRKSVGPTVAEKRKSTTVKVTGAERPPGKDHRRMRMATTTTPAATMASRPRRASDGNEVRRVVEQLNDADRQAFRSRCGQILSAPGRFSRTHVAICTAASL